MSATLTDDSLNPLANKILTFTLNGIESCQAMTDTSGFASCPITPSEAAGPYTLTAAFADSTDPVYATSSTSTSFAVTLEETTTTYTGPTVILAGGVTLSGKLLEDGTTPVAGRSLTLSVGGQSCVAGPTAADGTASCNVTFSGGLGPQPLVAQFLGDPFYLPSSDATQTATVFSFPSEGSFTLGDNTVAAAGPTTSLTWWGSNWSTLNSLSGGSAPSSFKGFAAQVTLPTSTPPASCRSSWQSRPGNSAHGPDSVPAYMGVLVTSSVTKAGSNISGTSTHIVVVKTDPGYKNDPGHPGTGTIVATYC